MSASTRNRRGLVYVYSATDDSGYTNAKYTLLGTYFCRNHVVDANERTVAAQADHRETAQFEFAPSVAIGLNDIVVDDQGVQWKVHASYLRKKLGIPGARLVKAERVDGDVYLRIRRFDGEIDQCDGSETFDAYVSALSA